MAQIFFSGNEGRASGALGKLQRAELIAIRSKKLSDKYSYYQLTRKGCALLGLPPDRAEGFGSVALARNLGVLWFATMSGARRARLRDDQLPPECPTPPGKPPHVAEEVSPGRWRIHRLYVVGDKTGHESPFREIQKVCNALQRMNDGTEFLRSGAYGFAILVQTDSKKARFEEALPTLMKHLPPGAPVIIATVPSPETLHTFLSPSQG